jgi:hypothetical protein
MDGSLSAPLGFYGRTERLEDWRWGPGEAGIAGTGPEPRLSRV